MSDPKFRLTIDLGNAAMQSSRDVARTLKKVADRIKNDTNKDLTEGKILDDNGNSVGSWEITAS